MSTPGLRPPQTGNHFPDASEGFTLVSRASTGRFVSPETPQVLIPNESELLPPLPDDPSGDLKRSDARELLVRGEKVPNVRPILLGFRSRLLEKRIDRIDRALDGLRSRQLKAQFAARSILHIEGYWRPHQELRPSTLPEIIRARALEATAADTRNRLARNHQTAKHLGATLKNGFTTHSEPHENSTVTERRAHRQTDRMYKKERRKIERNNRRFARLAAPGHAKAKKLIRRRDRMVLKQHAIANARSGQPAEPDTLIMQPTLQHETVKVSKGRLVQLGDADERGKITIGRVYDEEGQVLAKTAEVSALNRELLINTEDGTHVYVTGNTMYSWRAGEANPDVKSEDIVMDPRGQFTLYRPQSLTEQLEENLRVGRPVGLDLHPYTHSAVETVVVRGNMSADAAAEQDLPHLHIDIFRDARVVADQIDRLAEAQQTSTSRYS